LPHEIYNRLPLKLRNEYEAAWDSYATACRRDMPQPERTLAYQRAREQEDKLTAAVAVAAAEYRDEKAREAADAPAATK
jgi:hypothetical protein